MTEEERISSSQQLDAVLARNELNARQALLDKATGRSFRWQDLLVACSGGGLLLWGLYDVHVEQDVGGVSIIVVGLVLLVSLLHHQNERRIEAMAELVRRSTTASDAAQ